MNGYFRWLLENQEPTFIRGMHIHENRKGNPGADMTHKMLIVDDSPSFREMFRELLIKVGFDRILEASDYDEAMEIYRNERPDMVFIDMILPGKSGVDLTRDIVREDPSAIVIAISSIINKKLIKEALHAGARDFLFKPTNELALDKVIQMWGRDHT